MTKARKDDGRGWKRGAGPYSRSYPKMDDYHELRAKERDVSGVVDENANRNEGRASGVKA